MDKKEKALRFGISILESVSDLLTAAVVGILLVAGLIHYFNWKCRSDPLLQLEV